jgi:hypothetical protein
VTVNTVSPGIIMVDGLLRFGRKKYGDVNLTIEEVTHRLAADKVFDLPPAGRLGTPEDLAVVVCTRASASNARPRAMILSRDPWLDMLLVPASRNSISAKSVPAVVAYVHSDSSLSSDRCEQLAQLFDLLPSEARPALALV